jgi:hypothetical protein
MVPLPEFQDFASFNAYLEQKCREEFFKTSAMQEKTIGDLFSEEMSSLHPLPDTDFEARRVEVRQADSLSLVRFDCNDYSVPGEHAHKEFTVVGSIDTVTFFVGGEVVAVHERDWGRKGTHYNPLHYLAIAECRPNGLDFGAPFASWHLPKEFGVLRRRLESKAGRQGKREYIRILRLLERFSLDQVSRGISRALSSNTTAYEGIRLYVECETTVSVELFSLAGRPLLQQVKLPEPDINVYSTLLETKSYEKTRNETNGIIETSSATTEVAGFRARLRGDGLSLREGEHRSLRLFTSACGAGAFGSGGPCGGAPFEGGKVSEFEDIGELRLQGSTFAEQDARESIDAWGIHCATGIDHSDWSTGHGQDALGNGFWDQGLPDGKKSAIFPCERSDHTVAGGEGGETTPSDEEESVVA